MPSFILKVNKEEDLYVYWSTVVESPHTWGTKDEVFKYLTENLDHNKEDTERRFERANERGTSAFAYRMDGGWDDSGFIFEQRGVLPRANLKAFIESFNEEIDILNDYKECPFDLSLLIPFEDRDA